MSSTVFYQAGDELATLTNTFTVAGTPTDPTSVTLTVTDPQGVQTIWTWPSGTQVLTHTGMGAFQALQAVGSNYGLWNYVWDGAGTASDVVVGNWRVFPLATYQWYTSLEEVKSRLGITDANSDYEIQLAVETSARWIESRTGRHFYQMTDTRTYVPESIWEAHVDDLVSVTTFQTDPNGDGTFPVTWTQGTDFELALGYASYNVRASGEPRPYKAVYVIGGGNKFFPFVWPLYRADRIKITGVFGWPNVPPLIRQAALILAVEQFKLKDSPFGVMGTAEIGVQPIPTMSGTTARPAAGVIARLVEGMLETYIDESRKVGV